MFMKFHQMLAARRRRRAFVKIRREFARCGYPLDGKPDVEIEAALPVGMCRTPPDYIGAKTISHALRRLSIGTRRQPGGETNEAEQPSGGSPRERKLRPLDGFFSNTGGRRSNKEAHERA